MHIIFIVLLGIISIAGLLAIIKTIHKKKQKALLREELRQQVTSLRLSKMLAYIGADLDAYLDNLPPEEINKHIFNCSRCAELELCDACLRDGKIIKKMCFCPNYRNLMSHSKTIGN